MFVFVNSFGTANAALFFMSSFSCPFVCLLPIVTIFFFESEKVFLSPQCVYHSDGAKVCLERLRGLPRIALYLLRTAFVINNSTPTRRRPICYIPLLSAPPVFMNSSPINTKRSVLPHAPYHPSLYAVTVLVSPHSPDKRCCANACHSRHFLVAVPL